MRTIFFFSLLTGALLLHGCDSAGNDEQLQAAEQQLTEARATIDSLRAAAAGPGFIHTVFFWLKEDLSDEQRARFLAGLQSLKTVSTVRGFHTGAPAGTPRDVVDNSYDYALILHFDDPAGQDAYQVDPIHLAFVETCQGFWTRVQVYDTLVE